MLPWCLDCDGRDVIMWRNRSAMSCEEEKKKAVPRVMSKNQKSGTKPQTGTKEMFKFKFKKNGRRKVSNRGKIQVTRSWERGKVTKTEARGRHRQSKCEMQDRGQKKKNDTKAKKRTLKDRSD